MVDSPDVLYQRGVGSGWAIDRLFGGATGWGAKRRVRRAYKRICENYANPNATAEDLTIDIIGFSRGAATALHLANVIYMMGIRAPRKRFSSFVPYRSTLGWMWFSDWPRLSESEMARIQQRLRDVGLDENQVLAYDDILVPQIRFLGLYDAVSSFVLPVDTRAVDFQSYGFGFRLHVPPNVGACSHAMALDERRKSFRNVRVHPASMERARALRSEEVGLGSLYVAIVIAGLWLVSLVDRGWLGPVLPWTIGIFVCALGVAFSHMILGSEGDAAERVQAGERTDVQHQAKQEWAARMGSISGVAGNEIAGLAGIAIEEPLNAARGSAGDVATKAMAPGLGAVFALIGLALVDWFGGFDTTSVNPMDYVGAVAWAFATTMALAILGPAIAADTTSLRSRSQVVGLAARRLSVVGVVTAWALATWWFVGLATNWWGHEFAEPWLWLVLLVALGCGLAGGTPAGRRPTMELVRFTQDGQAKNPTIADQASTVATMCGFIVFGAWVVRRLASRGVELTSVPWWQYVAIAVGAGVVSAVLLWRMTIHETTVPPSTSEIQGHFVEREAREMWFRGNHTDIGGGGAPGLCDHPLQWMTAEARRAGLTIDLTTIEPELGQRLYGDRPDGVGPTPDPVIARARRLILDGDLGHPSVEPSTEPVPEDPITMAKFNRDRLARGSDLLYDPTPERSGLSRAIARRFMSPYSPRFVGVLGRVTDPDDDHFEWVLESSAGRIFAKSQQTIIDRWG